MTRRTDKSVGLSSNFKDRADSAAFYEAWVGAVLSRGGLYTVHHPFTLAETREDIDTYAHTWDLDVARDNPCDMGDYGTGAPQVPVEVKSTNLTFHTPDDYPFNELLVCSQSSWEKKWKYLTSKTKRSFLFVSRKTGAILWLPCGSPISTNHEVHDATRNQLYKAVKTESKHLRPVSDFISEVKNNGPRV